MKQNLILLVFLTVSTLIIGPGCKKETTCKSCNAKPAPINHPPVANAGQDQTIVLPVNTITLDGSFSSDSDNNIAFYQWKYTLGPYSLDIVNPMASQTKVTNLVEGVYQFELKVTDAKGLVSRDTLRVTVDTTIGNNVITFNNLEWNDPVSCGIYIDNIDSYFPQNSNIDVYVRADYPQGYTSAWSLADLKNNTSQSWWVYQIVNGKLRLSLSIVDCNFDVNVYSVRVVLR